MMPQSLVNRLLMPNLEVRASCCYGQDGEDFIPTHLLEGQLMGFKSKAKSCNTSFFASEVK